MCQQCLYSSWCIFPQRLGCISYISFSFVEILDEKIRIISTQVVKDHWTNFGFLKLRSQFVVSYSTILFCEMTVVSHFVIITIFEFLFANTTDLWIFEMFHVCICEDHILQKIELFPNQSSSLLFVLRITGSCLNNFLSKQTTWKQKPHGLFCWY